MTNSKPSILVTGACGQLGTELTQALRLKYGAGAVLATDRYVPNGLLRAAGPYEQLNVLERAELERLVRLYGIRQIYHLAATLSANGEKDPQGAWDLNMASLLHVLEVSRLARVERVFWPSSIAVFGPDAPKAFCPQQAALAPSTVYGISKSAGEQWCHYYHSRYGLDVRSLRYPGLISYSAKPGGGTTDYAVDIFHQALEHGAYTCFLSENTRLPMLYMPDAIRATLQLMAAPAEQITIRTSYNLSGLSFSPAELARAIAGLVPGFDITYAPDFRQQIADSWPWHLDDRHARKDWGWTEQYDIQSMSADMLQQLKNLRVSV